MDPWLTAVALVLLLLVAVNSAIFLFASYEYRTSSRQDPWLRSTQVLLPQDGGAGSRSSVVLLHGFGGTPRDFRSLAEFLAARGFRVVVPALPDQTSTSFAYGRGRVSPADYVDWLGDLIRDEAATSGRPPMLVGTSMGGTLAVIAAAEHSVGRLVLIAPYFALAVGGELTSRATAWLKWVVPVIPKLAKGQISDPEGYREYQTGSYLVSLRAFEQLAEIAEIAKSRLPGLTLPILAFASENDSVASYRATERLLRDCRQARLIACNRSNHVLTYDFDRERIMAEIAAFLAAEASPAATAG
jgi:carboxylesterase